jgi:hypothetical protein
VSGTWIVPKGSCSRGSASYSAAWVGLGGYAASSGGLEQTGTELDCTRTGHARYSAWYEILPDVSRTIRINVHPGDAITASVQVRGTRVSLKLRDLTTGARFSRTIRVASPDVSSAEWIVEAPSTCDAADRCVQLPLGNFGTVPFSNASATTARGHIGAISDAAWTAAAIDLRLGGRRLARAASLPGAVASALAAGGTAFAVTYQPQLAAARVTATALARSTRP